MIWFKPVVNTDLGGCKPQSSQWWHLSSFLRPKSKPCCRAQTDREKTQSQNLGCYNTAEQRAWPFCEGNNNSVILRSVVFSRILTPKEWNWLSMLHKHTARSHKTKRGEEQGDRTFQLPQEKVSKLSHFSVDSCDTITDYLKLLFHPSRGQNHANMWYWEGLFSFMSAVIYVHMLYFAVGASSSVFAHNYSGLLH